MVTNDVERWRAWVRTLPEARSDDRVYCEWCMYHVGRVRKRYGRQVKDDWCAALGTPADMLNPRHCNDFKFTPYGRQLAKVSKD